MSDTDTSESGVFAKLVGKKDKNDAATDTGEIEELIDGDESEIEADVDENEADSESEVYDELNHRVGEIEQSVERTGSAVRALQSEQQSLGESMQDLTDTNRRLLGVYDQLVGSANPFRDDGGSRFGVLTSGDEVPAGPSLADEMETVDDAAVDEESVESVPTDGRRSFADLVAEQEADSDERDEVAVDVEVDSQSADDSAVAAAVARLDEEDAIATVDSVSSVGVTDDSSADSLALPTDTAMSAVQLYRLPRGYAADVLAMEWLSDLVMTAGTGGALKALSYYERIGWLGPDARHELERVLSGALDEGTDRELGKLSAVVHDRSFRYIARLRSFDRMSSLMAGV